MKRKTDKSYWYIKVRCELYSGKVTWEYGRPNGGVPYSYISRELAENAARLWGDAYTRGDVVVVKEPT